MTRDEAIQELAEWINQMKDHGVPNYSAKYKALGIAIEALQAEPKHGHWIERAKCEYRCDQCGKIVFADDENELNYCCCCGAKMSRYEW